jgi:hypothetical protein
MLGFNPNTRLASHQQCLHRLYCLEQREPLHPCFKTREHLAFTKAVPTPPTVLSSASSTRRVYALQASVAGMLTSHAPPFAVCDASSAINSVPSISFTLTLAGDTVAAAPSAAAATTVGLFHRTLQLWCGGRWDGWLSVGLAIIDIQNKQ